MNVNVGSTGNELWRWLLCGAAVVVAHAAVPVWLLSAGFNDDAVGPVGAMVIDLAPVMSAPSSEASDIPPGPDQVQADAVPEVRAEPVDRTDDKIETKDTQDLKLKIPQEENADVIIKTEPPKPDPKYPVPQESQIFAPLTTASQIPKVEEAQLPAAPQQTQLNFNDADRIPVWRRQISNKLERNKRYPEAARLRGERGVAQLEFSLDRRGYVASSRIIQSSGSSALDRETLELVRRSEPFPAPPAAMEGTTVALSIPIQFSIR